MKNRYITGIQQIGVGTVDMTKSWDWYIAHFGTDVKVLEDDTVAERMLPYTGGKPQKRHACIAMNLQGGGGLEIWQYSDRKPVPAAFEISVGDLGIFAAKIKCSDVKTFHDELKSKCLDVSDVSEMPDGSTCFYVIDLYGNCFQIVERQDVYIKQDILAGGVVGAMVGVSDMDSSVNFYKDVLGYERVIYDKVGVFDDWSGLPDGNQVYRRVLLASDDAADGAFSELLTKGTIELVQAKERTPRKIYENRFWGDPGFIQICYDVVDMRGLEKFCNENGCNFTVDSCSGDETFNMGDASGHFTYIEDPDGTLIEFVETYKIPVAKRLGWFIDVKNRKNKRPLPKILFRIMGLVSRKKIR